MKSVLNCEFNVSGGYAAELFSNPKTVASEVYCGGYNLIALED